MTMITNDILSMIKFVVPEAAVITQPLAYTTATASVNLKNYAGCLACILIADAGTGSAITMKQGTTSSASTALSFTKYYYVSDVTALSSLTAGTATSDTFTTGTGTKTGLYIVPILGEMLDKTFESEDSYVRMHAASAANATGVVFYIMFGARSSTGRDGLPSVA
jgi:hypothetical protein